MGDEADSIASMYWGDEEECDCNYRKWNKTCKYCGRSDLHWEMTYNGWRLYDEWDNMHSCLTPQSHAIGRLTKEVIQLKSEVRNLKELVLRRR